DQGASDRSDGHDLPVFVGGRAGRGVAQGGMERRSGEGDRRRPHVRVDGPQVQGVEHSAAPGLEDDRLDPRNAGIALETDVEVPERRDAVAPEAGPRARRRARGASLDDGVSYALSVERPRKRESRDPAADDDDRLDFTTRLGAHGGTSGAPEPRGA